MTSRSYCPYPCMHSRTLDSRALESLKYLILQESLYDSWLNRIKMMIHEPRYFTTSVQRVCVHWVCQGFKGFIANQSGKACRALLQVSQRLQLDWPHFQCKISRFRQTYGQPRISAMTKACITAKHERLKITRSCELQRNAD